MTQPQPAQGVVRIGETPEALQQYMAAQIYEYSQWIAATEIYDGNALAFPKGYPVPVSTVERLGWDRIGLVERHPDWIAKNAKPEPQAPAKEDKPTKSAPKVEGQ